MNTYKDPYDTEVVMTQSEKHLQILGFRARDRITGLTGVISSISFDLYGCVQALLHPGVNKDTGEMKTCHWFDVSRLEMMTKEPVMVQPDFCVGTVAEGKQGSERKPTKA